VPTITRGNTDLYAVLGVDASAGGDDIARAFRARPKELHPDTSDAPDAARRFNDLVRAYEVLANHRTRREYDQSRVRAPEVQIGPAPTSTHGRAAVAATRLGSGWTARRAWTAFLAGALVAVLGIGAAVLTWQLHQEDARRHARFHPVTATRVGDGDVVFTTADGHSVRTREPRQHGEGTDLGPTVAVRYDPADPTHVIVDANTLGRDITLAIVSLKLLVGGVVFVVLGARRLRARRTTGAR
jgi:hypothetical protein